MYIEFWSPKVATKFNQISMSNIKKIRHCVPAGIEIGSTDTECDFATTHGQWNNVNVE